MMRATAEAVGDIAEAGMAAENIGVIVTDRYMNHVTCQRDSDGRFLPH
jgi:hypothetical protein